MRGQRAAHGSAAPQRNPLLLGGALVVVGAAALLLWRMMGAAARVETKVAVLDAAGKPFRTCKLELFEFDDTAAAPARPSKLGELVSEQTDAIVVQDALAAEYARARATVDGVGVLAFLLRQGAHPTNTATIAPAVPIAGVVQDASGQALAGARVEAIGGGEHGIVVGEAASTADGRFTLAGVSPSARVVQLRVFKAGFAAPAKLEFAFGVTRDVVCKLVPTEPVSGRVVLPPGVAGAGLVVQAYAHAGLAAATDAGGKFSLDHLPPNVDTKLIVKGLPAGYTHRAAIAHAGQRDVEIVVTTACQISGTIVDGRSGEVPALAVARHDHGPRGQEMFRLDEFGRFLLTNVPEGEVVIEAFRGVEREKGGPYAALKLQFARGEIKKDVAVKLE